MAGQRGQIATYVPPKPTQPVKPGSNKTAPSQSGVSAFQAKRPFALQRIIGAAWRSARTTLKGQFITLSSIAMLLAVGMALIVSLSYQRAADDLNTIANGSIPSIDAAQAIAQYVADIDAKAADYLATATLSDTPPCALIGPDNQSRNIGNTTVHSCDKSNIDAEFVLLNQQLFNAAHNVTYAGERTAVERSTEGLNEYAAYLAVMFHEYDLAVDVKNSADEHMLKAYKAYQAAGNVLHSKIERALSQNADGSVHFSENKDALPACSVLVTAGSGQSLAARDWIAGGLETNIDCLTSINYIHLSQAYSDTASFLGGTLWLLGMGCLVLVALLVYITWRMIAFTHRVINPGLVLGLLTCLIFSLIALSFFGSLNTQAAGKSGVYKQLAIDDYNSVYDAARLKRYGTDANADESRWLVALAFHDAGQVAHWSDDWQINSKHVSDLMALAHANQTYPEELQPLQDMDSGWTSYTNIDKQIRAAGNDTADPAHINKAEGLSTGDSNKAFGGFSDALDRLSKVNYDYYNVTLQATQGQLQSFILLSALIYPLVGLLVLWGVSRRLGDF